MLVTEDPIVADACSTPDNSVTNAQEELTTPTTSKKKKKKVDMTKYLEQCSKTMFAKAEKADHLDKIGIGEALHQLGVVIYKQKHYNTALRVFKRAIQVQENVLKECMIAVAVAMRHQGLEHSARKGQEFIGILHLGIASQLMQIKKPNETHLQLAWDMHKRYLEKRSEDDDDAVIIKAAGKVARRLKRARNQRLPLAHSRKFHMECKHMIGKKELALP